MVATLFSSLMAGGAAGFGVDVALFPLDTIKTRMQASDGFLKAGGFKGVYRGIGPAAVGSAPSAALFFCTYEMSKQTLGRLAGPDGGGPSVHMASASAAEVVACLVRVPTENLKQKMQAGQYNTAKETFKGIISKGGFRGFYAGYWTTVLRDVPFSFIQFPIWEKAKAFVADSQGSACQPWQGALCGSFSGSIAAFLTTPLDVVKTRLMLGKDAAGVPYTKMTDTFQRVHKEGGLRALWSGWQPRVGWISVGGLVYFGIYEYASKSFQKEGKKSEER